jgi:hypothetical protein
MEGFRYVPEVIERAEEEALVAHVRDLRSGEISVFVGTDHIVHRDPELAARLYNAARGDGLVPSER